MSDATVRVKEILKANGYSVTPQRLAVFRALVGQEPASMAQLNERIAGALDKASLYRTITLFEKTGIVNRIAIGWKYKIELSEQFLQHHHHLVCIECHKIIPITESELERFISHMTTKHRFSQVRHRVEIEGYCEACQKKLQRNQGRR